ncbi:MAG: radical SAM protein [Desulfovibrionaceae bacterium]|nr:radical SAM protein [Desulfovibrionaceae bacterium]
MGNIQDAMMVFADKDGQIYDHPALRMVCRKGREWSLPHPSELMPLPEESELFFLPGRKAVGLNPETGEIECDDNFAVAAFIAPAHTISAHPAYSTQKDAPILPLFAYCAVGFADGRFVVSAHRVDPDKRQEFAQIKRSAIERGARNLLRSYPKNRLVRHILNNCVARYDCPAARNFALGRYEAPLPTSRTCNARCLGCISEQEENAAIHNTPQCRLTFTPTPAEIAQVMTIHAQRERSTPIFSFGQGCEGDPLQNAELLRESIALYRKDGHGTINCNTNGSRPEVISDLACAGLTSIRVSINSAREKLYQRYYRPHGYDFSAIEETVSTARSLGLFVSLNLLFFPGITDTEEEIEALTNLIAKGVSMIQLRNLNIDPEWYIQSMADETPKDTFGMGLSTFMKRLKANSPWLRFGYFNPWLGDKAVTEWNH